MVRWSAWGASSSPKITWSSDNLGLQGDLREIQDEHGGTEATSFNILWIEDILHHQTDGWLNMFLKHVETS
jgi:hypothetical protein